MVYLYCTKHATTGWSQHLSLVLLLLLEAFSKEEGSLQKARISDGFDSNVYKMKRSGYDFSKPPLLGSVIETRPHGLSDTRR